MLVADFSINTLALRYTEIKTTETAETVVDLNEIQCMLVFAFN